MASRYADSLVLVWRLAEFEARILLSTTITPSHLLLGLCKCVDVDLPSLLPDPSPNRNNRLEELLRDTRRLRELFTRVGLDPKRFRRSLRPACLGDRSRPSKARRLERTPASKEVFMRAAQWASLNSRQVLPIHLLHALLLSADSQRDELLSHQGVEPSALKRAARESVTGPDDRVHEASRN
jgi:ATP-dependent Clp protease ATP-binding subunit ClpC